MAGRTAGHPPRRVPNLRASRVETILDNHLREQEQSTSHPTRRSSVFERAPAMPQLFAHLGRDVRDAMRSLARRPGFTAIAALSLAIGIGANTAIFSLVNAIVLRKTPIEQPERMVNVYLHQAAFPYSTLSYPELRDLRDGAGEAFAHIGSSQIVPAQVDGQQGIGTLLA